MGIPARGRDPGLLAVVQWLAQHRDTAQPATLYAAGLVWDVTPVHSAFLSCPGWWEPSAAVSVVDVLGLCLVVSICLALSEGMKD